MEKKTITSQPQKSAQENKKSPASNYSAMERAKAVLSVWTENRRPSELCRELQIKYVILNFWQNRAMEGMLQALEPRVNLEKGPALPPRLQKFLEKRQQKAQSQLTNKTRLEERLKKINTSRKGKNLSSTKK